MKTRICPPFLLAAIFFVATISGCTTSETYNSDIPALAGVKQLEIIQIEDTKPFRIVSLDSGARHADTLFEAIGLMNMATNEDADTGKIFKPLASMFSSSNMVDPLMQAVKEGLVSRGIKVVSAKVYSADLNGGLDVTAQYASQTILSSKGGAVLILIPQVRIDADGSIVELDVTTRFYQDDAYDPLVVRSFKFTGGPVSGNTPKARLDQWMASGHAQFSDTIDQGISRISTRCVDMFRSTAGK